MVTLSTAALWALVGLAAVWDVAQRRIPNPLIVTGLLLGLGFQAQAAGLVGLGLSLSGIATALAVLIGPFALRKMGGGDVKLAMVCGAFLAWDGVLQVIVVGAAIHGVVGLSMLGAAALARRRGKAPPDLSRIPHAIGFAVATILFTTDVVRLF